MACESFSRELPELRDEYQTSLERQRRENGRWLSFLVYFVFAVLLWCLLDLEVYRFSLRSSCSKLSDRGERTTEQTLFPNTTEEHAMVTLSYTPLPAFLLSRPSHVLRVFCSARSACATVAAGTAEY